MKISQTPWEYSGTPTGFHILAEREKVGNAIHSKVVGEIGTPATKNEAEANAAHIVRCVNAHDELLAACICADGRLAAWGYSMKDPVRQKLRAAINTVKAPGVP